MPRNIEFNNDDVMRKATHVFRRHGYAGTSIKSLEQATGLSSGSLYNSFGGKDAIFSKVLSHYNKVVVRERVKKHLLSKPPEVGIRSLFLSLLDDSNDQSFGCLLTNSAVEFGATDFLARSDIEKGLKILQNGFQSAIDQLLIQQNAKTNSALVRQHTHSATKLLALYQGVLVLVRFGRPKNQLRALIENEINQLIGITS